MGAAEDRGDNALDQGVKNTLSCFCRFLSSVQLAKQEVPEQEAELRGGPAIPHHPQPTIQPQGSGWFAKDHKLPNYITSHVFVDWFIIYFFNMHWYQYLFNTEFLFFWLGDQQTRQSNRNVSVSLRLEEQADVAFLKVSCLIVGMDDRVHSKKRLRNTQQVHHIYTDNDENIVTVNVILGIFLIATLCVTRDLTMWATLWKQMWLCHCILQSGDKTKIHPMGRPAVIRGIKALKCRVMKSKWWGKRLGVQAAVSERARMHGRLRGVLWKPLCSRWCTRAYFKIECMCTCARMVVITIGKERKRISLRLQPVRLSLASFHFHFLQWSWWNTKRATVQSK